MPFLSWRLRKKIAYSLGVIFALALLVGLYSILTATPPSCSDGKKNQGEEGIDCGGPCTPCVVHPEDIVTVWTRVVSTGKKGLYDVASLVENPNLFYGLSRFKYTFKLYDSNNVLVAVKEGQTYLNPGEKFVVFAGGIKTGERVPVRAFMEIEPLSAWKYIEKKKIPLVVSSKNFENTPFPTLTAKISNESIFDLKEVSAVAVLYDENENVLAVSSTYLPSISAESSAQANFTWPNPLSKIPAKIQIYTRVNLVK